MEPPKWHFIFRFHWLKDFKHWISLWICVSIEKVWDILKFSSFNDNFKKSQICQKACNNPAVLQNVASRRIRLRGFVILIGLRLVQISRQLSADTCPRTVNIGKSFVFRWSGTQETTSTRQIVCESREAFASLKRRLYFLAECISRKMNKHETLLN